MRELLRGSLRQSLRELGPADRLAAAWPVACGSALAARGEMEGLEEGGVLQVRVESAEWMRPFLATHALLASELGKIAGVPVAKIHFYVRENTQLRAAAASSEPSRSPGEKH